MRKIYKVVTLILFVIASLKTMAQVNYNFSASQGTYTALARATTIALTADYDAAAGIPKEDEGHNNSIPIGFNFYYNKGTTAYTTVRFHTDGFLALGTAFGDQVPDSLGGYFENNLYDGPSLYSLSTSTYNSSGNSGRRPIIAPFWGDLAFSSGLNLTYQTSGTAPNRVFTVEWKNAYWTYQATAAVLSFQVKLYETTNIIEFVYRKEAGAPSDGAVASIGLTAAGVGRNNFISLQDVSTNPQISKVSEAYDLDSVPATGQIYRFTPVDCVEPTTVTATAISGGASTLSWDPVPGAAGYQYATSTTSTPPASGTNTTATSVSVGGLNPNVVNYLFVRTNCGASFSSWVSAVVIPCTSNTAPANHATNVNNPPTISWNAVPGAEGYAIMISSDGTAYSFLGSVDSFTTSVTLKGASYNTQYYFYVRPIADGVASPATCQSNATSFTTMAKPAAPANDNCQGAGLLTVVPTSGTTYGATQTLAASSCNGYPAGDANDDVWYKLTALYNGNATVTLTNPSPYFDAVMEAYSGSCASPVLIACKDSSYDGEDEVITLTGLQAGQTYFVRVYEYNGEGSEGNFSIAASGSALPITLANFRGERVGTKAVLSWTTATEQNNKGFELQRSADGKSFSSIAFINSKAAGGNSSATLQYSFDDVKAFAGNNYYRLKQVDKDGKSSLSGIVLIKGLKTNSLKLTNVYPNPAVSVVKAVVTSPSNNKIMLVVTDLAGKVVMKRSTEVVAGDNNVSLDVAGLATGNYMLKVICENGCETAVSKFVKQ